MRVKFPIVIASLREGAFVITSDSKNGDAGKAIRLGFEGDGFFCDGWKDDWGRRNEKSETKCRIGKK